MMPLEIFGVVLGDGFVVGGLLDNPGVECNLVDDEYLSYKAFH